MTYLSRKISVTVAAFALATCVLLPLAQAQVGVKVDDATAEQKAAAQKAYKQALADFKAQHYEPALAGFRQSYAIVASPNAHIMVANVMAAMGRRADAYEEFDAVIAEANAAGQQRYAAAGDAAHAQLKELRAKLGLVTVNVTLAPGGVPDAKAVDPNQPSVVDAETAKLTIGGRVIPKERWGQPVPVEPGKVAVVLSSWGAGGESIIDVKPGGTYTVPMPPPPEEQKPAGPAQAPGPAPELPPFFTFEPPNQIPALVAGGVGALGLLSFAIFGGLNNSVYADLEEQCSGSTCPADLEEDANSGRGYQTAANVSAVIGVIGISAGAGLYVWQRLQARTEAKKQQEPAPPAKPVAPPQVSFGPGSVIISGRF